MMQRFDPLEVPLVGRCLVEASAGTGKTYAITTLFVRLVLEAGLGVEQILVVTFTEAATAELRDRVRRRLAEAVRAFELGTSEDPAIAAMIERSDDRARDARRLTLALSNVDLAAIQTIHGFCHRVLHDSAFDSGVLFEQEVVADLQRLRDEVIHDYWVRQIADAPIVRARALAEKKVDPDGCRGLVDKVLCNPELGVVPAGDPGDLEALDVEWRAAVAAAQVCWSEAEVVGLLEAATIKRNLYRKDWVVGWGAQMSAFLARPGEVDLPGKATKFCPAALHKATKAGDEVPTHAFFAACETLCEVWSRLAPARTAYAIGFLHGLVEFARQELPKRKEEQGVLSFDDLLLMVRAALRGGAGAALAGSVRARHAAALIDEFQDTDPVQYEVFSTIYAGPEARLFLVGDPKQAIYSFRGADVFAYLQAAAETSADRRFTMGQNWRSSPSLVGAVNQLFARLDRPFLVPGIDYPEVVAQPESKDVLAAAPGVAAAPLEILFVGREPHEGGGIDAGWEKRGIPNVVAFEVAQLLRGSVTIEGATIAADQVAVLTRTNDQAFAVQKALREVGVPGVVLGDRSVFESEEATDLRRVLAAIVEPGSGGALRAALTTELLGVTANELLEMEEQGSAWEGWVQDMRAWNELWMGRGFVQMFRALVARRSVQQRLLACADGERRMTNLLHLMELLHVAGTSQHLGPVGLLHWFESQGAAKGYPPEAAQVRLESDEKAVRITTVHRAKGLEYDVVYCPHLWSGMLIHPGSRRALEYHHPDDGHTLVDINPDRDKDSESTRCAEREAFAESLRLLYVAVTRARHRCTLVAGAFKQHANSALSYVLHPSPPPDDLTVRQIAANLKGRTDDQLRAEIAGLVAGSAGGIGLREIDRAVVGEPAALGSAPGGALECRAFAREVDRAWRIASFSQLTAAAPVDLADGRERDEAAPKAAPDAAPVGTPTTLRGFPRGARVGNFFHDLLEHADFTASGSERAGLVADKLAAHGLNDGEWEVVVGRALDEVIATPMALPSGEVALADVPCSQRLNELEFHLPVALDAGPRRFTPDALASALREHPSEQLPASYAERVAQMHFMPLWGFLKGYVDLVFTHGGRWYVVDYKSNYLGDHVEDYVPERLTGAMAHGDYFLQYHLYAVAVHRYLGRRLPGYDYDQHFGGAAFLFLRGMTPGSRTGVFFERPPRARIEALSAALAQSEVAS